MRQKYQKLIYRYHFVLMYINEVNLNNKNINLMEILNH